MNGWMRVWVVCSVLWIIGFVTYAVPDLPDTNITDNMVLRGEADPDATWEEINSDEFPIYFVTMRWDDGTSLKIKFPVLTNEEIKQTEDKIKRYSVQNGKNYSPEVFEEFLTEVKAKNSEARRIANEYSLLMSELNKSKNNQWWTEVWAIIAYSVGGSVIMLVFGYTVDWIRDGFK